MSEHSQGICEDGAAILEDGPLRLELARCDHCQHSQQTVKPWKYVPKCKTCGRPMKDNPQRQRGKVS